MRAINVAVARLGCRTEVIGEGDDISPYLHLVFSVPAPSVSAESFSDWYRVHLEEILEVPGWHAARRYSLTPVGRLRMLEPYPFLACYEVSDDLEANMEQLLGGKAARRANGPAWVAQNRYASWNAAPDGPSTRTELAEHTLLVVAAAPGPVHRQEFDHWHRAWLEGAATDPRVVAARRFRLSPSPVDEAGSVTPAPTHLALLDIRDDEGRRQPGTLASLAPQPPGRWRDQVAVDLLLAASVTPRVAEANVV